MYIYICYIELYLGTLDMFNNLYILIRRSCVYTYIIYVCMKGPVSSTGILGTFWDGSESWVSQWLSLLLASLIMS